MSEHLKLNLSVPPLEEAETLVRRMSGVCLSAANTAGWPSSKDEKVLKLVTFSLQKYLKVMCIKVIIMAVSMEIDFIIIPGT